MPKSKKNSAKKSGGSGATETAARNRECGLSAAPFEEESWRACVCLVVGRGPDEEQELTRVLALTAELPIRKLFSFLTWDGTLAKICELGDSKGKKSDSEVMESAKALLDAGQEVPSSLMAKVLKFQLLQIKASDQQRRKAEQAEKAALLSGSKDKGKAPDRKGNQPSSGGASKEKKTSLKCRGEPEPPNFIDDEPEDGPQHYILLLGFHQPLLIGALDAVGVHVSSVIRLCSEQPLVGQQERQTPEGGELSDPSKDEEDLEWAAKARTLDLFWSGLRPILDSRHLESRLHDMVELSYTFPQPPSPGEGPDDELEKGIQIFEGVAFLIYDCLEWQRQHQHYLASLRLIRVPTVVGPPPQRAQVVSTPSSMTPHSKKKLVQWENTPDRGVDMRYYSSLLDRVPLEACSVPLLLHCLLEQVVMSAARPLSTPLRKKAKPNVGQRLDYELVSFMLHNFLPLVYKEEERSHLIKSVLSMAESENDLERLMESFGAEETQNADQPLVVRHHDERTRRLREAKAGQGLDPAQAERSMMRLCPASQLIHCRAPWSKSDPYWRVVKQQLRHHLTDDVVSWLEVERLFHQSVFESMPLSGPDQTGVLVDAANTAAVIPWDNPLSYARQQLHLLRSQTFLTEGLANTEQISERTSCQLDLSDIQSCRQRFLGDWLYSEHHEAGVFTQVLQSAWDEFRCVDTFRGSHNNILYVFCHNPTSPYRHCKEFWDAALHTDVRFRNYLLHVAESISDWTKVEELKREAAQLRNISPAECSGDEEAADSADEEEELEQFIRKDSLKAWKLEQEMLKEEQEKSKTKKENPAKGKQQEVQAGGADSKKSGKKAKGKRVDTTAKTPVESVTDTAPAVEETTKLQPTEESFSGYSTGGRLIRVTGCLQYLFPSDGGLVTVENISYLEGSRLVKVIVKKDGHHFCTHVNQVAIDPAKPRPDNQKDFTELVVTGSVKQGSFTALLHNGIHLSYSFYGPTGEHTVSSPETVTPSFVSSSPSTSTHCSKRTDLDSVGSESNGHLSSQVPPLVCEEQPALPFSSLSLSVPSGLLLQFQREDTRGASSREQGVMVRQSFPLHRRGTAGELQDASLSRERARTITSTGAVIRHLRDGSAQVLFADGSVSFSPASGPAWVPEEEEGNVPEESEKEDRRSEAEPEPEVQRRNWLTTTPCGERIHIVGTTHQRVPTTLLFIKATDPITHEVMLSREDLVVSVQNPDGSASAEHADGTRITSLYQHRPPNTPQYFLLHSERQFETPTLMSPSTESMNDTGDAGDEVFRGSSGADEEGVNGEESVFEAKSSRRSAREGDPRGVSPKERVVLVEKEGCATVVMYPERCAAHVFLADGTVIIGNNQGAYEVFPSNVGVLEIQTNGKCVYSSEPRLTASPTGGASANQPGSYSMSHSNKVAFEVTDPVGNHFQVMDDGQLSVLNSSPALSSLNEVVDETRQQQEHRPRLFLVHADSSGTELLSSQTVEEVLYQATSDPSTAVLKEPLQDTQDEFGITILKPGHRSVWSQWLLGKQNPDITPPNLRNRSWQNFPRTETKSPGPPLGANMCRSLSLGERPGGSAPVRCCPDVLEMRELLQHRTFSTLLTHTVDSRLKEYIESLMEREQQAEQVKVIDPPMEEESAHTGDLLNLVLSFAEEECISPTFDKRTSVDLVDIYSQQVGAPDNLSNRDSGKKLKWTERLARHRQEMCEEQTHRAALKNNSIVPFFHPENFALYQNLLQHQTSDASSSSVDVPPIPTLDSSEDFLEDAAQQITPRPLNPTPSRSASYAAGRDAERRPSNPTSQTAGDNTLKASSGRFKSIQVDVTGRPRRTKVRLPASILGSKPVSVPKQQFLTVEEPVRRRCRTTSLTNPEVVTRGFELFPSSVDFGTLQEGSFSAIAVTMKNVGVDTCRFHVKQPPPATGLRVIYQPGPVAAGLRVELQVQLLAKSAVQAGEEEPKRSISQDIIIHTEMDILYLHVTATILPQWLYEIWLRDHKSTHKQSSGIHQLPSSLPGGQKGRTAPGPTQGPPDQSFEEPGAPC